MRFRLRSETPLLALRGSVRAAPFLGLGALALGLIEPLPGWAEESPRLLLEPGLPNLEALEVPELDVVLPEHRLSGDGLVFLPEEGPYAWTRIGTGEEPIRLRLEVDGEVYERGVLTVWDWHNRPVARHQVDPGKAQRLEVVIRGLGSYLFTFDGWREGRVQARLLRNLAVTEDQSEARSLWKCEEFFLGICAMPGRYHWLTDGVPTLPAGLSEEEARGLEAERIARLGFQVVRVDVSLDMNPRPDRPEEEGAYDFDFRRMDAAVSAYTTRGFQLALQAMHSPDWAVSSAYADQGMNRWRYPHREGPQRAYLAALVKRYGQHARFVQVFNEPDQVLFWAGPPEDYVALYRYSRDEIRRIAPAMPVINGGYALVDEARCAYFIEQLHGMVDRPAYHSHGNLAALKRSFARMRQLQEAAGDRSENWLNTESGYSAWRLDQERRQGQIDPQKALYTWAHGHRGLLLFCSRMIRGPGRDGSPDFGLLDYQFSPRFAYASVSALVSALAGASYLETLAESESTHLYLFQKGEDLILAGFTLDEEKTGARVRHDARSLLAIDEMGNRREIPAGDPLDLVLDGYPRYWLFQGASRVALP